MTSARAPQVSFDFDKRSRFRLCEEQSRHKNAGEAYPVWVRQTGRRVQYFRATKLNPKK